MNEIIFFINKVVFSGLIIGSIYALGAIGITLIFGILRFAHFAHGELMTLGGFISLILASLFISAGVTFPLPIGFVVMPLAMAMTAFVAIIIDQLFYKPLRDRKVNPMVIVITSVGITLMLQGLIRLFAGTSARTFFVAEQKDIFRFKIPFFETKRDLILTEPQILLIVFTLLIVVGLHFFLQRTQMGKAMRAMSDNADLARISGINTRRVVFYTWIIGGGLAAAAGTLLALDVALKPDLSFNLLLPIFAAAILGGIGQPYGAIVGGFIIGFAETLAVFNWAIFLRPFQNILFAGIELPTKIAFVPPEYKLAVPFVILIIVLVWRPTGLFKGRVF